MISRHAQIVVEVLRGISVDFIYHTPVRRSIIISFHLEFIK